VAATSGDASIELIGAFRVRVGDHVVDEIDWPQRKPKALIKLLALAPGHRLHREQLLDTLWPDLDLTAGGNNLRKAVFHARSVLGHDLVVVQGELVSLAPGSVVDLDAFEEAASRARLTKDPDAYRDAIAFVRGDLLPEDRYEDWVASRQASLRAEGTAVHCELAALLEARGELGEAAAVLRRALGFDPLDEEPVVPLVRVLAASGQRSEAIAVYESFRDTLERELGTEPGVDLVELYQEILTRTEGADGAIAERWEHVGDLRMMAGDHTGAARALGAAIDQTAAPHPVRLERKAAMALLMAHDADAGPHLDRAEALLDSNPDDVERANLLAARVLWHCGCGEFDAAAEAADASRALAEATGDPEAIATSHEMTAIACHYRGVWRDGLLLEIERVAHDIDDASLGRVFDIHHCIGQYHLYGDGLVDGVEDYARQVLEVAGRRGAARAESFGWCLLGEALLLRGRLDEAEACLMQSTELHARLDTRSGGLPWQRLGEVRATRGDLDGAHAAVTRGMAIATMSPMASHLWGRLYATSAFIALERGDAPTAVSAVRSAEAATAHYGDCPTCSALLHPMAAEAYAACDDARSAAAHAEVAAATAASFQSSAWSAMAESAAAEASRAAGDTETALRHLEAAADLYERVSHSVWASRWRSRASDLAST
jgi:DNA-binding SARP family transcriptional activator